MGVRATDFDPAAYPRTRWALVPGFLSPAASSPLQQDILTTPTRRVTVGAARETWTEHAISGTKLCTFLESDEVFELAARAVAVPLIRPPLVWAQSYVIGEKISWHCDGAGAIQLLLCLAAPPAENGGAFCMRTEDGEVRLAMQAGDALLFKASEIPHCTTRLVGTPDNEIVRRITAVARFYALPKD